MASPACYIDFKLQFGTLRHGQRVRIAVDGSLPQHGGQSIFQRADFIEGIIVDIRKITPREVVITFKVTMPPDPTNFRDAKSRDTFKQHSTNTVLLDETHLAERVVPI